MLGARSAERLETLARSCEPGGAEVLTIPTDVTDPAQRQRLIDETARAFGGIDILINNAGVGATGDFHEANEERLRRVFEINFFGATELNALRPAALRQGRQPMVVNVSSVIGRRAIPGYSEYCASKFALCGWSKRAAGELAQQGIHVLLVNPGLIETPFRDHLVEDRLHSRGRRPKATIRSNAAAGGWSWRGSSGAERAGDYPVGQAAAVGESTDAASRRLASGAATCRREEHA